jgi:hypothetical protein
MPAAIKGNLVTAIAPIAATDTTAVTVSKPSSGVVELPDSDSDADGDSTSTTSMKKDPSSLVDVVGAFKKLDSLEVGSLNVSVSGSDQGS